MSKSVTVARSLHDLGLATWFGGNLMGAVGLNGGASDASGSDTAKVSNSGWARFTPVNAVAIGAHLVGAVILLNDNKSRVKHQDGVLASSVTKTLLTAAALGATAVTGLASAKVLTYGEQDVETPTTPSASTPADVAKAQKTLKTTQWLIPALTGALIVVSAVQGEQQKTGQEIGGRASKAARKLAAKSKSALG